jgi:hypothetical protein
LAGVTDDQLVTTAVMEIPDIWKCTRSRTRTAQCKGDCTWHVQGAGPTEGHASSIGDKLTFER